MNQPQAKRQHYHSLAVELTLVEKVSDTEVAVSTVNEQILLHKHDSHISLKDIRRVQQQAQMNLFAKMQNPTNITVQNVVILNISHLGFMTEAEWMDGIELPKSGLHVVKTDDVMPAPDQVQ